jgi:hypothetical protein
MPVPVQNQCVIFKFVINLLTNIRGCISVNKTTSRCGRSLLLQGKNKVAWKIFGVKKDEMSE